MLPVIESQTKGGVPFTHGGHTLTPFSQSFTVRIPGLNGGLIWNRPVSVLAQGPDGREEIIPIPDVTRQVQWALWGAALAFGLVTWLIARRK